MPELPEVETVVRDLRPMLIGQRVVGVHAGKKALRKPWFRAWNKNLLDRRIEDVKRRGKWILLVLNDGQQLLVHLGMTGQLLVQQSRDARADHTHLVLDLDQDQCQLRFRDERRFGSATLFATEARMHEFFHEIRLGPEPFDLTMPYWRKAVAGTRRNLKAILLDQRVVAGVGNIYADESLFEARLHPARLGRSLKPLEADRLRRAIAVVLNRAIGQRGSSIRNYVGGSGLKGEYQEEFRVYGQSGQPCRRCRSAIERIRLAGRSTHFCPRCQR